MKIELTEEQANLLAVVISDEIGMACDTLTDIANWAEKLKSDGDLEKYAERMKEHQSLHEHIGALYGIEKILEAAIKTHHGN